MDRGALVRPVVESFREVAAAPASEEPVRVRVVVVEARTIYLALDRVGVRAHQVVIGGLLSRIGRVVVGLRQELEVVLIHRVDDPVLRNDVAGKRIADEEPRPRGIGPDGQRIVDLIPDRVDREQIRKIASEMRIGRDRVLRRIDRPIVLVIGVVHEGEQLVAHNRAAKRCRHVVGLSG